MSITAPLQFSSARQRFYRLASWAEHHGLLTAAERDTIARIGHRKERYWSRHLLDLRAVLAERTGRR